MADIDGEVAPGFEGVRDAFVRNFDEGHEVGAAFSAYHRGEKVVDLWGGVADQTTGQPWERDTLVMVFSTTKGFTAIAANKLAQEGLLDVDAPVVDYWPEFGANGKDTIPVSYLLSHQAGLAWVDGEMTAAEALSWDPVIAALETQVPAWTPGEEHGYHATTYGWLVGELIRRVTGRSVGTYLRDEIAGPLGLDLYIGLPAELEPKVARLINMVPGHVTLDLLRNPGDDPFAQVLAAFLGPDTDLGRSLFAPGLAFAEVDIWDTRAVREAEVPSFNGVTDARSVARLYGACVAEVDGIRVLTDEQVKRATVQQTTGPNRVLLNMDIQFGLGFMLHSSLLALGGRNSFGHFGAGGSVGWADPDSGLSFGYVMNRMDLGVTGDARSFRLINACYEAIK